ncbi:protein FAM131C [Theropithecus gelada]|uniref:protein FAM131C n=1 Tax=Theropithecus gelada TaxID=9565 RepID=UPI000DC1766D|nr:protein FAM131C [Theropithecus gelada]
MGSCVSRDLFTSAHKDCPMPQGTDPLNPDLPSGRTPTVAVDPVTGKDKQMDFCWDPWQRCFQTTNGYLSDSRSCPSNYNVAALATSSLVGVVQSIKDHITKPTAMARGRVAHLIEWKGWSAQRAGWELSPAEDEHYCCLPDELREARFAAAAQATEAGKPQEQKEASAKPKPSSQSLLCSQLQCTWTAPELAALSTSRSPVSGVGHLLATVPQPALHIHI